MFFDKKIFWIFSASLLTALITLSNANADTYVLHPSICAAIVENSIEDRAYYDVNGATDTATDAGDFICGLPRFDIGDSQLDSVTVYIKTPAVKEADFTPQGCQVYSVTNSNTERTSAVGVTHLPDSSFQVISFSDLASIASSNPNTTYSLVCDFYQGTKIYSVVVNE